VVHGNVLPPSFIVSLFYTQQYIPVCAQTRLCMCHCVCVFVVNQPDLVGAWVGIAAPTPPVSAATSALDSDLLPLISVPQHTRGC